MKYFFLSLVAALGIASCSSDSSQEPADSFDRSAMLVNWADNIIVPSYTAYNQKVGEMHQAAQAFAQAPDLASMDLLKAKWLEAYKAYQHIGMFNIGKAEELQFSKFCNTYPADGALISSKAESGDLVLAGAGNDVAQGFPAMDFLLYGMAQTPEGNLAYYTSGPSAQHYRDYLLAVTARLQDLGNLVLADWNGGYKNTFVSKTDNTSSGSVNRMVNAYVQYFEKEVRSGKVGIPAGRFSNGTLPEKVEGYYSRDYSRALLQEGITASRNFFNGKHFASTATGASLGSYLQYLQATGSGPNGNETLAALIDAQFGHAMESAAQLQPSLYDQVVQDNSKMLQCFDKMQRNVAYMKTDMVSAMSISIDYADTDGD